MRSGLLKRCAVGWVVLAAFSCAPEQSAESVSSYLYSYDLAARTYRLEPGRLEHLESLRALRGRDIELRSGAGYTGVKGEEIDLGSPFSLTYSTDTQGTLTPTELQDLYGVTVYHHLDSIASTLREHGHVPDERLKVLFFPYANSILLGDQRSTLMDNAAYDTQSHVFLVLPAFLLSGLPLLLNYGVLGHEYGHAVIDQELGHPAESLSLAPFGSMHEGVADLLGFAVSADPNFVLPSAPVDRDLSVPANYTAADLAELSDPKPSSKVDPHRHGSFIARAIYEAWPKDAGGRISAAERGRLLDTLLRTLRSIDVGLAGATLAAFPNKLVDQIPEAQRSATCAVFHQRLAPLTPQLTQCAGYP